MKDLTESGRATREAMESSAAAIQEIAGLPTLHGVEGVRLQLEQVERHIAETFKNLDERDQMLTERCCPGPRARRAGGAGDRPRRRGDAGLRAGRRRGGRPIGAAGRGARGVVRDPGRRGRDENVRATVREEVQAIGQQLDLMVERMGIDARDQVAVKAAMERFIGRGCGLAEPIGATRRRSGG